eukprot:8660973-Pyramimonas_sp.AAC.1
MHLGLQLFDFGPQPNIILGPLLNNSAFASLGIGSRSSLSSSLAQSLSLPPWSPNQSHSYPVTRVPPSGEKAHDHTPCLWPVSVRRRDQFLVLHTRVVQSSDPVTRVPPSGEKAHDHTPSVCP